MAEEEHQPRQVAKGNYIAQALGDGAKAVVNVFRGGIDEEMEFRNRRNMLELVWNTWIEGVLKQSLHNEVLIELGMETKPDAVEHPWDKIVQMPDKEPVSVAPGTTMLQLFDQANGFLLILGEPGSGKTTMLLELCRQSIERAREDPLQPIPFFFNLSSWNPKPKKKPEQALTDWLLNELRDRYKLSPKIGHPWIKNDALLLLLDGLDEVKEEYRETCVQAINAFRAKHDMQIVVCSRMHEYEDLSTQLHLRGVVFIQPLTNPQVDDYLHASGQGLTSVQRALQRDPEIQEFARTPLILSILVLAFRNASDEDIFALSQARDFRKNLFNAYITQMFKRRGLDQSYKTNDVLDWLSWLARAMVERGQTLFAVEDIQPGWLPYSENIRKLIFGFVFGLIFGLIGALIGWLSVGLFGALMGGRFSARIVGQIGGLSVGVIVGLISGIIVGLIGGPGDTKPTDKLIWSWRGLREILKGGLIGGLIGGLGGGLIMGVILVVIFNPASGMLGGVAFGLIFGLLGILTGVLIGGLSGGLSGVSIEMRTSPADGINTSMKNWIIVGLSIGLIGMLSGFLIGGGLQGRLGIRLVVGVIVGLSGGLIGGLYYGGNYIIKNFLSRWLLYRSGHLPWSLIAFLDYCTGRIFLRRVGGSYRFIHRMLLEHFAEMEFDTED